MYASTRWKISRTILRLSKTSSRCENLLIFTNVTVGYTGGAHNQPHMDAGANDVIQDCVSSYDWSVHMRRHSFRWVSHRRGSSAETGRNCHRCREARSVSPCGGLATRDCV